MAANPVYPAPQLRLETEKTSGETIVRCTGKITVETAAQFKETVCGLIHKSERIVVDLANVSYVDSVGLGAFVEVWTSSKRQSAEVDFRWPEPHNSVHRELKLINLSGPIRKLFHLTRLDKVFGVSEKPPQK